MSTIPTSGPQYYIHLVKDKNIREVFELQQAVIENFFNSIPANKWSYRYTEDKWSIKELLQHMIDTERVFAFRALWCARKNKNPLPGFDENEFAQNAEVQNRSAEQMQEEFLIVRKSSQYLLDSFSDEVLQHKGFANGQEFSALHLMQMIAGHFVHHKKIIEERYL